MWKRVERVAQAAESLTGSAVDRVGSKIRVGALTGSGQKSGSGSDRVRDGVSIRFDRVKNGSGERLGRSCLLGQANVSMTSADQ